MPRRIPLLSVWKKEDIRKRVDLEINRGFGKGIVLPRIQIQDNRGNQQEEQVPAEQVPEQQLLGDQPLLSLPYPQQAHHEEGETSRQHEEGEGETSRSDLVSNSNNKVI